MLTIYRVVPTVEMTVKDEFSAFLGRRRHAPAHVHACPNCYGHEPCGMDCYIEHDLTLDDGTPAGHHLACSRCERHFAAAIRGNAMVLGAWADDGGALPDPDPLAEVLERPNI